MIAFLLFAAAVVLLVFLAPVGFAFAMAKYCRNGKKLKKYFYQVALTIDQSGNVVCAPLFNGILLKRGGHPFGDEDETISSAVGRNKKKGTLTWLGRLFDKFLSLFEKNHSLKSIGN